MTLEEGLAVERGIAALDQFPCLQQGLMLAGLEILTGFRQRQGVRVGHVLGGARGLAGVGLEPARAHLDHAAQAVAALRRPPDRGGVQLQARGDLVQQGHRVLGLAVQLVDEGDDRDVAQAADLEQLQRLRLDALGGVQHHDGAVGGGQGAVGVFREVLVPGRVEEVEHLCPPVFCRVLERHHRGGDGDAALLLDLHPVRLGAPVLAARAHGTGRADGSPRQQDMLGQGGLARIGVRDDGEGPAAQGLLFESEFRHGGGG